MYMGGTGYSPQIARIISYAGLIIPFILTGYGYLHAANIIASKKLCELRVAHLYIGIMDDYCCVAVPYTG